MKFKHNDVIRLKPDADVTLSYKSGSPPQKFIKGSLWIVDSYEELDDDIQNLNISTFEPEWGQNAGSYCSWVFNEDVLEKVNVYKIKKENIMKKSELKQLIKEQISLMGYIDDKSIIKPEINSNAINFLLKNKEFIKEETISNLNKKQLKHVLLSQDNPADLKLRVDSKTASSQWLTITKEQLEAIIKIFE